MEKAKARVAVKAAAKGRKSNPFNRGNGKTPTPPDPAASKTKIVNGQVIPAVPTGELASILPGQVASPSFPPHKFQSFDADGNPIRRERQESEKHRVAFEALLTIPFKERFTDAGFTKAGKTVGVGCNTIRNWSKYFGWRKRVQSIEEASQPVDGIVEPVNEQMEKKRFSLELIDCMIRDSAILDSNGRIVESKVKLRTMADIRAAWDTRAEIISGGRNRTGSINQSNTTNQAIFIIKK